jgi:uncharacterized RDD family membrane protein YckC
VQHVRTQEQVDYASVGWRFAAVLVDTLVLFGVLMIVAMAYIVVSAVQGRVNLNDPAAAQALTNDFRALPSWVANVVVFGGLFLYYAVLEAIFGASVGKLVFRMRVTMPDGSRPRGTAVVLRNLVRIPEAYLLYIPAGLSCLASPSRQRLGDHAARTVVVRRPPVRTGAAADGAAAPAAPPAPATAGAQAWQPAPEAIVAPAPQALPDALERLKTAALATRGAHFTYLHFSERELAAGPASEGESYSGEYVSAWFTLADAVAALRRARDAATAAAASAGLALDAACAAHPDLVHLLGELAPYVPAVTDEEIHDAFLTVARGEATAL